MIPAERLHVFDLERLDVQVVEPQQGNGIVDIEAIHESLEEVDTALDSLGVGGVLAGAHFNGFALNVHAQLELKVFDEGRVDARP